MMKRKIQTPKWVNGQTIYEVNLRQYTKSGTFKEFESHLPRLKELGVGILWFMPIQPIGKKNRKGTLGSYYSVSNYTDVNPEFGTIEEFKSLVKKVHDLGMKVIIDWVANHTAWDHHWTKDHPEFYTKDENGNFKAPVEDWEDVIHLDYGNPDLWDEMINEMSFWLKETDIDGFRCDMAHLVPTLFWNRARRDLDKIKPIYMLAESENHDLLEYAFDSFTTGNYLHAMDELAAGNINANELLELALNEIKHTPEGSSLLNFTSNHDENSWQGSAIERIHYYLEPLTVLNFSNSRKSINLFGQEAGNYRRLKFFDKDEIEWKEDKMFELYKKLTLLKKSCPSLNEGTVIQAIKTDAQESILAFTRKVDNTNMIVLLNLSKDDVSFHIECGNFNKQYRNVLTGDIFDFDCHKPFLLSSYAYLVLVSE